mmetsp:Transcript_25610/g.51137  ORF Transcript_25610/g.51137 Transcript_25610/m.51137 type:complete len:449 (+) Transcript_25610:172-1518(+)
MLSLQKLSSAPLSLSRLRPFPCHVSVLPPLRQFSSDPSSESDSSSEPAKRTVPAPAWLSYARDRNAYRSKVSALRSRYLADYLAGIRAEALARKAEQEEVARLKKLRLEAKRERAILGVKRDMAEKEEAKKARSERLKESIAKEEVKKARMVEIKGRAVARMEELAKGDAPHGTIVTSHMSGGAHGSLGSGWLTSLSHVDCITDDLFTGSGKILGERGSPSESDFRYVLQHERKRRTMPELMSEFLIIQRWIKGEGDVTLSELPPRDPGMGGVVDRLMSRLRSRHVRAEAVDAYVEDELGGDHDLIKKFKATDEYKWLSTQFVSELASTPAEDERGNVLEEDELTVRAEGSEYRFIMAEPFERDEDAVRRFEAWLALGQETELYDALEGKEAGQGGGKGKAEAEADDDKLVWEEGDDGGEEGADDDEEDELDMSKMQGLDGGEEDEKK